MPWMPWFDGVLLSDTSVHPLRHVWSLRVLAVYFNALIRHGIHSPHYTEYDVKVLPPAVLGTGADRHRSVAFPTQTSGRSSFT